MDQALRSLHEQLSALSRRTGALEDDVTRLTTAMRTMREAGTGPGPGDVGESEYRQGDVVRYIPMHAHGNASHPDAETGTVSSTNANYVFVRFGANETGKACKPEQLLLMRRP
jgi:hypothetical protein